MGVGQNFHSDESFFARLLVEGTAAVIREMDLWADDKVMATEVRAIAREAMDTMSLGGGPHDEGLAMVHYRFWADVESWADAVIHGGKGAYMQLREFFLTKKGAAWINEEALLSSFRMVNSSVLGTLLAELFDSNENELFSELESWYLAGEILTRWSFVDPGFQVAGPGIRWWHSQMEPGFSGVGDEAVADIEETLCLLSRAGSS
jgi:hypothetical protein